jgi:hypothetical protein
MGEHILTRDVDRFRTDLFEPCQWKTTLSLAPIGSPFYFGTITLIFTTVGDIGSSGQTGWFVIITGLPAIGAAPADVEFYGERMFGFPDTRPFRCLSRNTLYNGSASGFGSGNFEQMPDAIIVQPFWP